MKISAILIVLACCVMMSDAQTATKFKNLEIEEVSDALEGFLSANLLYSLDL